jgi:hypothetical protein
MQRSGPLIYYSAVYTTNQNSKTVIKTIIDGSHLGKIIDQK